jgi:hypothetical protein
MPFIIETNFDCLFKSIEADVNLLYALKSQMFKTLSRGDEILEDWKIKISVLWLFEAVALVAYMTLGSLEPGALHQFLNTGEIGDMKITPELLLLFAILILVPMTMAFLSVALENPANRWANIIVGIVFIALNLIDLVEAVAQPSAWMTLMILSKIAALALIVWYTWKSKQKT